MSDCSRATFVIISADEASQVKSVQRLARLAAALSNDRAVWV